MDKKQLIKKIKAITKLSPAEIAMQVLPSFSEPYNIRIDSREFEV